MSERTLKGYSNAVLYSTILSLWCTSILHVLWHFPGSTMSVQEALIQMGINLIFYTFVGFFYAMLPMLLGWFPGFYLYKKQDTNIVKWGLLGLVIGGLCALITFKTFEGFLVFPYLVGPPLAGIFMAYFTRDTSAAPRNP